MLRAVTGDDPSMAFENELAEGFVKLHGPKLQRVTNKTLAQRISAVLAGEADVAFALFDTPERRQVVDFTVEVLPTVHTIATCRPQTPVASTEELRTRQVGAMQGSIIEELAPREPQADAGVIAAAQWAHAELLAAGRSPGHDRDDDGREPAL